MEANTRGCLGVQSGLNTGVISTMKPGREGHRAKKGRNAKVLKAQSQIISTRNTDGQSQNSRTSSWYHRHERLRERTETQEGGRETGKRQKVKRG